MTNKAVTNKAVTNKAVIIAIVGESGSGKTYAAEYLKRKWGWDTVVSYTTRPLREGETDGVEHHFVREDEEPPYNRTMASTVYGGYSYWTLKEQFYGAVATGGVVTYIVDETGLRQLLFGLPESWADVCEVVSVRVHGKAVADAERMARDGGGVTIPDECYDYVLENNGSLNGWERALDGFAAEVRLKIDQLRLNHGQG